VGFWSEAYLNKRRKAWLDSIAKAQYYANGTWYDGQITEKIVNGDSLYIKFTTTDSAALTITQIRLLDTSLEVAGSQSENIVKSATQGVLLQLTVPIKEL
jgi:hypothetical protein